MILITGVLNYSYANFEVLFPTYRLLILIFDNTVWSAYSNVLHVVLNSAIANIAVIIRADVQITLSCPKF